MEVLFSAGTKDAVLAWGKQQHGYCRSVDYSHGENKVVVLLIDRGSGVRLDYIYVYATSKGQKEWRLILFRPTDAEVEVREVEGKLVFRTVTQDVILVQSLDAIGPFGEMVRRKAAAQREQKVP